MLAGNLGEQAMDHGCSDVGVSFVSAYTEEFLVAELEAGGVCICGVLKQEEDGPVFVAFREDGREILVDPEVLIAALKRSIEEIRLLRRPSVDNP
ncbi:MAG: hypothetical protein NTW74_13890 [Acidobacteria bacterium]|nr:hypothetical protein [Acidobacteriota bacterium]